MNDCKFLSLLIIIMGSLLVLLIDSMPWIILKYFHFDMKGNIALLLIIKFFVGLPLIAYGCYLMTKYTE